MVKRVEATFVETNLMEQRRMSYSNHPHRKEDEPKVIAISATRQAISPLLYAGLGLTTLAYVWMTLLVR